MRAILLSILFSLALIPCAEGAAGTLILTQDEVIAGAGKMYRKRMEELSQRNDLDTDAAFRARVERVMQALLLQAKHDYPNSVDWPWEIHIANSTEESAFCMAGGKILINQAQASALNLNDAELAMLIGHEMQHALQEHNLKEFTEALRLFPAWREKAFSALEDAVDNDITLVRALAKLNFQQEIEADAEGLKLAWRAGWPSYKLANYFKKLKRASNMPNFDSASHPASARRWQAARSLAETLDSINNEKVDAAPAKN